MILTIYHEFVRFELAEKKLFGRLPDCRYKVIEWLDIGWLLFNQSYTGNIGILDG